MDEENRGEKRRTRRTNRRNEMNVYLSVILHRFFGKTERKEGALVLS